MRLAIILMILIPMVGHSQSALTDGQNVTTLDQRIVNPSSPAPVKFDAGTDQKLQNTGQFTQGFNNEGNRQNADQSKKDSDSTQMLGLIMGAAFMSICVTPTGKWACAPAAMSFLDAALSGQNGGNSVGFSSKLQTGGLTNNNADASDPATLEAMAKLSELRAMGVDIDPATGKVSTENGEFTAQDFASQQALEARGFSAEEASSILDKLNEVREQALKDAPAKANAVAGMGAGSDTGSAAGSDAESNSAVVVIDEDDLAKKDKGGDKDRFPAHEAGKLSKNFNGDPIGISFADIFLMVKEKYQKEDKQNSFFTREY